MRRADRSSLLELGAGFSRDFSGRENIYLQGALYGLTKAELEPRVEQIIAFSELGQFIDVPVKTYSAGMMLRLGFSIAAHLDADVLLIDEVLAVGDEAFQRKCLRRISEQIAAGATLVLVSHDAGAIERVCERVVVLDGGRVEFDGPTAEGLLHYHRLMGTEQRRRRVAAAAGPITRSRSPTSSCATAPAAPSSVFRSGAPLQVIVALRARRQAEAPMLALELRAQDGTQRVPDDASVRARPRRNRPARVRDPGAESARRRLRPRARRRPRVRSCADRADDPVLGRARARGRGDRRAAAASGGRCPPNGSSSREGTRGGARGGAPRGGRDRAGRRRRAVDARGPDAVERAS